MQNLPYLFATYAIVWLVLFGYLFVVATQVRSVRREVELLKEQVGKGEHSASVAASGPAQATAESSAVEGA